MYLRHRNRHQAPIGHTGCLANRFGQKARFERSRGFLDVMLRCHRDQELLNYPNLILVGTQHGFCRCQDRCPNQGWSHPVHSRMADLNLGTLVLVP